MNESPSHLSAKITQSRIGISKSDPKPTTARFAIEASDLPRLQWTLPVAEWFRKSLLSCFRDCRRRELNPDGGWISLQESRSPVFAGKDEEGSPLRDHRHAYFLPTDEDFDGRLDHLTVYADEGFGRSEITALATIRRFAIREPRGQGWIELGARLLAIASQESFCCPLLSASREFISATPFLVTRHLKRRGRKRDLLDPEGPPNEIQFLSIVLKEELERWLDRRAPDRAMPRFFFIPEADRFAARPFIRRRLKAGDEGDRRPAGFFRISFDSEIQGPLSLGYSCHFGLGLFVPAARIGIPPSAGRNCSLTI